MLKSLLKLLEHSRHYFDIVAEAWAVDLATGQASPLDIGKYLTFHDRLWSIPTIAGFCPSKLWWTKYKSNNFIKKSHHFSIMERRKSSWLIGTFFQLKQRPGSSDLGDPSLMFSAITASQFDVVMIGGEGNGCELDESGIIYLPNEWGGWRDIHWIYYPALYLRKLVRGIVDIHPFLQHVAYVSSDDLFRELNVAMPWTLPQGSWMWTVSSSSNCPFSNWKFSPVKFWSCFKREIKGS